MVSTHSRPKAAGYSVISTADRVVVSTHSRPKAAGAKLLNELMSMMFQHTAARRRLVGLRVFLLGRFSVSTHSRPKAAGYPSQHAAVETLVSTHSRPKAAGGFR